MVGLLAIVPLVIALAIQADALIERQRAATDALSHRAASAIADTVAIAVQRDRSLLEHLAAAPGMDQPHPRCPALLGELVRLHPRFANATVTSASGQVVCSGLDQRGAPLEVGDTAFFRAMANSGQFTLSEPFLGPLSGRWVVAQLHPRKAPDGRVVGGVGLPLDLLALRGLIHRGLAAEEAAHVVSSAGVLVAGTGDASPGTMLDAQPMWQAFRQSGVPNRSFQADGLDGVARFWNTAPIEGSDWVAIVGLPRARALQPANDAMRNLLLATFAALALAIGLAWLGARRIAQPIRALAAAVRAVTTGDPAARAPLAPPKEVAEVGRAINEMIERRAADAAALLEADRTLRASEARYRQFFDRLPVPAFMQDQVDGYIQAANAAAARQYGIEEADFIGMPIERLRPAEDAAAFRAQFAASKQLPVGSSLSFPTRHVRRDGSRFEAEVHVTVHGEGASRSATVVALDVSERHRDLARIRRLAALYAGLSEINAALLRVRDAEALYQRVCEIAAARIGTFAWIRALSPEHGRLELRAIEGPGDWKAIFLEGPSLSGTPGMPENVGVARIAMREKRVCVVNDVANDPRVAPWRERHLRVGSLAMACVPLIRAGTAVGVLGVHAAETDYFDPEVVTLLERAGESLSFGLEHLAVEAARRENELALRDFAARNEMMSRRLLSAQEDERGRIARELHDEIGQALTAVHLNLRMLEARAGGDAPARRAVADSVKTVDAAIDSVRALSLDLRPTILDDLGLVPALKWFCERQAERSGVAIAFRAAPVDPDRDAPVSITCYRIVQEAVTNALRHAGARHIAVALEADGRGMRLSVEDDGRGFDVDAASAGARAGQSSGLPGMQERARLAGARFEVRAGPGAGTRIVVEFPGESRQAAT